MITKLKAVGWIDIMGGKNSHLLAPERRVLGEFEKGEVSYSFICKLTKAKHQHQRFIGYCGFHNCAICDKCLGEGQIFLPDKETDSIYVFPPGIIHYVKEHHYKPPQVFIDAVMRCKKWAGKAYEALIKEIDPCLYGYLFCLKNSLPFTDKRLPFSKNTRKFEADRLREQRVLFKVNEAKRFVLWESISKKLNEPKGEKLFVKALSEICSNIFD